MNTERQYDSQHPRHAATPAFKAMLARAAALAVATMLLLAASGCLQFTGSEVSQPAYGVPGGELPVTVYANMPGTANNANGYLYVRMRNNWTVKNNTWNFTSESRLLSGQVTYAAARATAAEGYWGSTGVTYWWGGDTGSINVQTAENLTIDGTIIIPTTETVGNYVIDYGLGDNQDDPTSAPYAGTSFNHAIAIGDLKIALGANSPPARNITNSDTNVVQAQLEIEVGSHVASYTINSLSFTPNTGGIVASEVTNIRLYRDNNDDGRLQTGGDTLLQTIAYANPLNFNSFTSTINGGQKANFLVVFDYTGTAANGDWLDLSIGPANVGVQGGGATVVGPTVTSNRTTISNQASLNITLGANNPSATYQVVGNSAQDTTLLQLAMTAGSAGSVDITAITLTFTYVGPAANEFETGDVIDIRIYRDNDGDGVLDTGTDPQLGSAQAWTAGGADTTITFSGFAADGNRTIAAGSTVNFIAVVDLNGTGSDSENMMVRLANATDVTAQDSGGGPVTPTASTPLGGTRTNVLNDVVINLDPNGVTFTTGVNDPAASSHARGESGVVAMQAHVQAPNSQVATINDLVLWNSGTITGSTDITTVRVYRDYDGNGAINGSDYEIASGVFNTYNPSGPGNDPNGCRIQISGGYQIPAGAAHDLLFVLDIGTAGTAGETIVLNLLDPSDYQDIPGDITVGTTPTEANLYTGPMLQTANTITLQDSTLTVAAGGSNPAARNVAATAQDVALLQVALTAGGASDVTVTAITFDASGSADDRAVGAGGNLADTGVSLWNDINGNGAYDAGTDIQISSAGDYSADNGNITFSGLSEVINAGQTEHWLLVYDLDPGGSATNGDTFQAQVAGPGSVTTSGTVTVSGSALSNLVTVDSTGTVTFTAGANNPGDANVSGGTSNLLCLHLVASANSIEDIDIVAMTLTQGGSAVNADVNGASIKLYHDINADGQLDGGDVQLGAASADLGAMTFSFGGANKVTVSAGGSQSFIVLLDVDTIPPATAGNTFIIKLNQPSDVTAYRGGTTTPAYKSGAPGGGIQTIVNSATLSVASGGNNPGASSIQNTETNVSMLQAALTASGGNVTISAITFRASGSGDDRNAAAGGDLADTGVRLYVDVNNNGIYEAGTDTPQLGASGNYNADNGTITFSGLSRTINAGTTENWIVVQDWRNPGTAGANETFQAVLVDPSTDINAGSVTPSGSTVTGGLKTIAVVTAITWNGSVSNDFSLAGNYDENAAPGASIDVTIPASASVNPALSADAQTRLLSVGANSTLTISTGTTLTCNADFTVSGTLSLGSSGSLNMVNGTTLTFNPGSTLEMNNNSTLTMPGAFTATGTAWTAGNYITVTSPSAGNSYTLDLQGTVTLDYVRFDNAAHRGLTLSGSGGAAVAATNVRMYGLTAGNTYLYITGSDWNGARLTGWGFQDVGGASKTVEIASAGSDVLMKNYSDTAGWLYGESSDVDTAGRVLWLATAASVTSFTARQAGDVVLLTWRTANEFKNLGFRIYRRELDAEAAAGLADERALAGLARELDRKAERLFSPCPGPGWRCLTPRLVEGANGSLTLQEYAWVDREVEAGKHYLYALVDVDAGGNPSCGRLALTRIASWQGAVATTLPPRTQAALALLAGEPLGRCLPGPFASRLLLGGSLGAAVGEIASQEAMRALGAAGHRQALAVAWESPRATARRGRVRLVDRRGRGAARGTFPATPAMQPTSSIPATPAAATTPATLLARLLRAAGAWLARKVEEHAGALSAGLLPGTGDDGGNTADRHAGTAENNHRPQQREDATRRGARAPGHASGASPVSDPRQRLVNAHDLRRAGSATLRRRRRALELAGAIMAGARATRSHGQARLRPAPGYSPDSRERPLPVRAREILVGPRLRVETTAEGLTRLALADLLAAGFVPERRFKLFNRGSEVNIWKVAADNEQGWDLCFYARRIRSPYTETNVYILRQSTAGPRPAPRTRPCRRPEAGPLTCEQTSRYERDEYYRSILPYAAGEEDHWFTRNILFKGGHTAFTLACPGALAGIAGRVRLMLRNYTGDAHVRVLVNNVQVGEFSWSGARRFPAAAAVPAGVLVDGDNIVTLVSAGDVAQVLDIVYTDWVELRYHCNTVTRDGRLVFKAETGSTARVGGITASRVVVADVSTPGDERPVERVSLEPAGDGTLRAVFAVTAGHTYAVSASPALPGPARTLVVGEPRATAHCEYLVVCTDALLEAGEAFAAYHANKVSSAAVYTLSDALDAGDHGIYGPAAIENLVRAVRPRYLLLLGDMTFDYAGVFTDDVDYSLPARLVASQDLQAVSDYTYALAGGEPYVAVGRVPARSVEQALAVLAKVKARDAAGTRALPLVVAAGDGQAHFRESCELAAAQARGALSRAYVQDLGVTAARARLLAGWNAGAGVVYFSGHGSQNQWARQQLFTSAQVAGLRAQAAPPIVVQLDCLSSGAFLPAFGGGWTCLAEVLLMTPDRGASAVVGSVAMTDPAGQTRLGVELVKRLQAGMSVGRAFAAAQQRVAADHPQVLRAFVLLGDPAGR